MEHTISLTSLIKHYLVFQPMKKMITRLLVSVSIFSLVLFSYSQNLSYFCSNSFHLIMNKNCIFFIFNGLLVFLAKTSGFVLSSPSSGFDPNEMLQKRIGDGLETAFHETKSVSLLEKDQVTLMEECRQISKDQEQEEEDECLNEKAEDEVTILIADSDEELGGGNDENVSNNYSLLHDDDQLCGQEEEKQVYEEEEEDDDDEQVYEEDVNEGEKLEMLSTDELNKKFEDFIRKMKEEIRINEVRQQLLMVN